MSVRIIIGDALTELRKLPDESVHCCVTSPPYWGLRDYGVSGQLGMEPSLGEHVATMVEVFREVSRVLRNDGTLWLNYGDCYAASVNGRSAPDTKAVGNDDRTFRDKPFSTVGPIYDPSRPNVRQTKHPDGTEPQGRVRAGGYLKPKDLCGIPWRIALALQEDGWWLRSDIIWSKPNPMPESITDRPTKAHEYLFLLAKSERYRYDAEAIAEPALRFGEIPGGSKKHTDDGVNDMRIRQGLEIHSKLQVSETRNKRSVWTVATAPYSEAHFATFPPALIEPCILAGCPEGGTVLDPFGGAGTTGLVADRLSRSAVLIELNPTYAEMARKRISDDAGGLFGDAASIATATVSDNLGSGSNTDSHPELRRWDCPESVR